MPKVQQRFIVKVHQVTDLVVAPKQNPFTNYEPECTGKAALPRAILRWKSTGSKYFSDMAIHLPSKTLEKTDKAEVNTLLHYYIKNRLEENKDDLFLFRRKLMRSFRHAIIFLSFCMILVSVINAPGMLSNMPILRSVLTEGFTVVGWVALWLPVELLINDLGVLRMESHVYHQLLQAKIHLVADDNF